MCFATIKPGVVLHRILILLPLSHQFMTVVPLDLADGFRNRRLEVQRHLSNNREDELRDEWFKLWNKVDQYLRAPL